jgi:hypothetical protein
MEPKVHERSYSVFGFMSLVLIPSSSTSLRYRKMHRNVEEEMSARRKEKSKKKARLPKGDRA